MSVRDYNREAWDREVERGNEWTVPVGPEVIEAARRGRWEILLTETRPVPQDWFPDLDGADVLCLASGGGQQAPVSNLFVPEVRPVWAEAYRVLRRGGSLLAGFLNPAVYIFDLELVDSSGEVRVRYALPYADATSKSEEEPTSPRGRSSKEERWRHP